MTQCALCDLPTPDPPVSAGGVEGDFCCRGCLEVYRTLGDAKSGHAGEVIDAPGTDPGGREGETAFLAVEGMHCSTCEAFIEARATAREGVLGAEASYPSGLVRLAYDPDWIAREDLPGVVEGLGYRAREAGEEADDPDGSTGRLLVGGLFGMMVMLPYLFVLYPAYLGVPAGDLPVDLSGPAGWYLLANLWVMATVVVGYTGYPILRGAYVSLRAGYPNMDLLVGLATAAAYAYSAATLLAGGTEVYFDVAVVIVLAVTVGKSYEGRAVRRAAGRLADLAGERADVARRRTPGGIETVGIDELSAGDEVVVRAGERVPVDGTVVEGTAAVDESLLTGESTPMEKEPGDGAVGGSRAVDGGLVVRVDPGAGSTLDRLVALIWEAQVSPGAGRLADRVAAVFVPLSVAIALGAAGWHLASGAAPAAAMLVGLSVLVVSCPCALGLATPLAVAAGVNAALRRGVVVADASVFERATEVETVALDKTGTLTTGGMRVVEVVGDDGTLERAAAVEAFSDHPLAGAIVEEAPLTERPVEGFERLAGGASALVGGERVLVGRAGLFDAEGWPVPDDLRGRAERAREGGRAPALVGWDGRARGLVVGGDEPREGWEAVVSELAESRRVVVITGDGEAAAAPFRDHPGVEHVFAGVPPEGKTATIERLRAEGRVAMVGDGSNDAPALAAADVGVALERGTRLAADAADAVVTGDDLSAVPRIFDLAAATRSRLRGNLAWAFCYNLVAIPLAVAGLLNPLLAAVAMTASSLLVVGNSARPLLRERGE